MKHSGKDGAASRTAETTVPANFEPLYVFNEMWTDEPNALLKDNENRLCLGYAETTGGSAIAKLKSTAPTTVREALVWFARVSPRSTDSAGELSDLCTMAAEALIGKTEDGQRTTKSVKNTKYTTRSIQRIVGESSPAKLLSTAKRLEAIARGLRARAARRRVEHQTRTSFRWN